VKVPEKENYRKKIAANMMVPGKDKSELKQNHSKCESS
jgi:hypothetical protein